MECNISKLGMQTSILSLFIFSCCLLGWSEEQEFSFRVAANGLQILLIDSFGAQGWGWLTVTYRGFDYREGIVACRNLSNGTMVDFEREEVSEHSDSDESMFEQVTIDCDNLPLLARDCSFSLESPGSVVSDITCESIGGYKDGDIRQLSDGRIVQLKKVESGQFVWGHFCARDNYDWDLNVSNLACQSLGYERAREGVNKVSIDDKFVYGLTDIDCSGAADFLHCTSEPSRANRRNCVENEVIAVNCEGSPPVTTDQITSQPLTTYSVKTVSNSYSVSTRYTSSHHPSYTTQSYKETAFLAQYMFYLIAGGVALGVVLFICTVGVITVVSLAILINTICYCRKPNTKEERQTPENRAENIEYDHYLRMEPHPNGFIKQDSEENKPYYNLEGNNTTRFYQHTYLEIHPTQDSLETSESSYAEIQSI